MSQDRLKSAGKVSTNVQSRSQDIQARIQTLSKEQAIPIVNLDTATPDPSSKDDKRRRDPYHEYQPAEAEEVASITHVDSDGVNTKNGGSSLHRSDIMAAPASVQRIVHHYQMMQDKLRQMAQLRMTALDERVVVKEESANMRNMYAQLMQEMRDLLESVKSRLPKITTDLHVDMDDVADWEDWVISLEDFLYESEVASNKFNQDQRRVIDLEWDLCGREIDLYEQSLNGNGHDAVKENAKVDLGEGTVRDISLEKKNMSDANHPDNDLNVENNHLAAEFDPDEFAIEDEFYVGEDNSSSTISAQQPESELCLVDHTQVHSQEEDTMGNGFQFIGAKDLIDIESQVAVGKRTEAPGITLHSGFIESDLVGFTRWLLHGVPWTPDFAGSQNRVMAVLSNPHFFRAWISYSFGAFCSGTFFSPHNEAAEDEQNVSALTKYVRSWMSGPHEIADIAHQRITLETSSSDPYVLLAGVQNSNGLAQPVPQPLSFGTNQRKYNPSLQVATGDDSPDLAPRSDGLTTQPVPTAEISTPNTYVTKVRTPVQANHSSEASDTKLPTSEPGAAIHNPRSKPTEHNSRIPDLSLSVEIGSESHIESSEARAIEHISPSETNHIQDSRFSPSTPQVLASSTRAKSDTPALESEPQDCPQSQNQRARARPSSAHF